MPHAISSTIVLPKKKHFVQNLHRSNNTVDAYLARAFVFLLLLFWGLFCLAIFSFVSISTVFAVYQTVHRHSHGDALTQFPFPSLTRIPIHFASCLWRNDIQIADYLWSFCYGFVVVFVSKWPGLSVARSWSETAWNDVLIWLLLSCKLGFICFCCSTLSDRILHCFTHAPWILHPVRHTSMWPRARTHTHTQSVQKEETRKKNSCTINYEFLIESKLQMNKMQAIECLIDFWL